MTLPRKKLTPEQEAMPPEGKFVWLPGDITLEYDDERADKGSGQGDREAGEGRRAGGTKAADDEGGGSPARPDSEVSPGDDGE